MSNSRIKSDDKLIMKANLGVGGCALDHERPRKAINYFCFEFGGDTLTLPICEECEQKSADPDWVLLVCLNCASCHWIHVPSSNRQYHYKNGEKVKTLPGCPHCSTFK